MRRTLAVVLCALLAGSAPGAEGKALRREVEDRLVRDGFAKRWVFEEDEAVTMAGAELLDASRLVVSLHSVVMPDEWAWVAASDVEVKRNGEAMAWGGDSWRVDVPWEKPGDLALRGVSIEWALDRPVQEDDAFEVSAKGEGVSVRVKFSGRELLAGKTKLAERWRAGGEFGGEERLRRALRKIGTPGTVLSNAPPDRRLDDAAMAALTAKNPLSPDRVCSTDVAATYVALDGDGERKVVTALFTVSGADTDAAVMPEDIVLERNGRMLERATVLADRTAEAPDQALAYSVVALEWVAGEPVQPEDGFVLKAEGTGVRLVSAFSGRDVLEAFLGQGKARGSVPTEGYARAWTGGMRRLATAELERSGVGPEAIYHLDCASVALMPMALGERTVGARLGIVAMPWRTAKLKPADVVLKRADGSSTIASSLETTSLVARTMPADGQLDFLEATFELRRGDAIAMDERLTVEATKDCVAFAHAFAARDAAGAAEWWSSDELAVQRRRAASSAPPPSKATDDGMATVRERVEAIMRAEERGAYRGTQPYSAISPPLGMHPEAEKRPIDLVEWATPLLDLESVDREEIVVGPDWVARVQLMRKGSREVVMLLQMAALPGTPLETEDVKARLRLGAIPLMASGRTASATSMTFDDGKSAGLSLVQAWKLELVPDEMDFFEVRVTGSGFSVGRSGSWSDIAGSR